MSVKAGDLVRAELDSYRGNGRAVLYGVVQHGPSEATVPVRWVWCRFPDAGFVLGPAGLGGEAMAVSPESVTVVDSVGGGR